MLALPRWNVSIFGIPLGRGVNLWGPPSRGGTLIVPGVPATPRYYMLKHILGLIIGIIWLMKQQVTKD